VRLSHFATLAIVAASALHAQGPATRRAHELVALIDSGSPSAIRAYSDTAMTTRAPADAHRNFILGQRDESRGLRWVDVHEESPQRATVVLERALTGDLTALLVVVDSAPPYRIVGLGLRPPPGKPGAANAPRVSTDAEMVAALKHYVETLAKADVFSGAVLLAKDGQPLYAAAFGEADKDFHAPNTLDTKFNLGSMNKMFTATAVSQLVEQGKLSYDDTLAKFIPDFPNAADAKKVRIENLLTHTSGLGSYFNDDWDKSSRALYRTVDDWMPVAKHDSLAFAPGTQWSYSNTGMLVAGKVVEVVSKQDYFDYIREHIYKPAGMTRTDAYELDHVNPNLAVGYDKHFRDDGSIEFRNNVFEHVIRGGPAGGGYSTVGDLVRFAEALKAGKLVSAKYYELMTTPKPAVHSPRYGYGFGVDPETGVVGHSGGFVGISSNLDIFKGSGYVAVVMSNYSNASQAVAQKMRELVLSRLGPAHRVTARS
jgi:CubicO group peptidase (beta-lactamase class C family)